MRRTLTAFVVTVVLLAGGVIAQQKRQQDIDLQAAIRTELVDGDLNGAIKQYGAIVSKYKADRAVAATALVHMAECYHKLGDAQARRVYEQLLRDYSDQKEAVSIARARLGQDAAAPVPVPVARQLWTGTTANDTELSIGADGRTVAILDRSDYPIGIRDLATGRITKLIASDDPTSGVEWPVLSPDMRRIAYTWYGGAGVQLRVAAAERDAKPRIVVSNPEFVYYFVRGWSHDGKFILSTIVTKDQTTKIAWVSVADGAVTTLKPMDWRNPGLLSLSPDGRFIAYDALTEKDASDREIRIMAADGSTDTVVVPAPAINESPVWTRDGAQIIFKSNRAGTFGLWSIPVRAGKADGPPKLVRADVGNINAVGFTATGSLLYTLMVGHRDVFSVDIDPATGQVRGNPVKAVETFIGSNSNPSWSPDGKSIAYISRRTHPASAAGTLVIKSLEGGRDLTVARSFRWPYPPMWLSDGATILQAARNAQNNIAIYKVDAKTGTMRETLNTGARGPVSPTVSTDGKTVYAAVFPEREERHVVAAFDLATGRRVTIDTGSSQVKSVAASPDGKLLAFVTREYAPDRVAAKNAPQSRLYLTKPDGSDARPVFTSEGPEPSIWDIAWTPDSRFIYFDRRDVNTSQLWRISATGGTPEYTGLSLNDVIGGLDVSRDGTRLVYGVGHSPSAEIWALDNVAPLLKSSPR